MLNEFTPLDDHPTVTHYALWSDITSDAQDIRCYEPPEGYQADADYTDRNPETGEHFEDSQWVLFLTPLEHQTMTTTNITISGEFREHIIAPDRAELNLTPEAIEFFKNVAPTAPIRAVILPSTSVPASVTFYNVDDEVIDISAEEDRWCEYEWRIESTSNITVEWYAAKSDTYLHVEFSRIEL